MAINWMGGGNIFDPQLLLGGVGGRQRTNAIEALSNAGDFWTSDPRSKQESSSSGSSTRRSQQGSDRYGYNFRDSESFQGIDDPEALGVLRGLIRDLMGGGSADYKEQRARRLAELNRVAGAFTSFGKGQAGADARAAVAGALRDSMERTQPIIAKATQGAGTSGSSMAGLLASDSSARAAEAAGRVSADQMARYGQIQASISQALEAFTRPDVQAERNLIDALGLFKVGRSKETGRAEDWANSWGWDESNSSESSSSRSIGAMPMQDPVRGGGGAGGGRAGGGGLSMNPLLANSRYGSGGSMITARPILSNNPNRPVGGIPTVTQGNGYPSSQQPIFTTPSSNDYNGVTLIEPSYNYDPGAWPDMSGQPSNDPYGDQGWWDEGEGETWGYGD